MIFSKLVKSGKILRANFKAITTTRANTTQIAHK